jgi:hypothetical protein
MQIFFWTIYCNKTILSIAFWFDPIHSSFLGRQSVLEICIHNAMMCIPSCLELSERNYSSLPFEAKRANRILSYEINLIKPLIHVVFPNAYITFQVKIFICFMVIAKIR